MVFPFSLWEPGIRAGASTRPDEGITKGQAARRLFGVASDVVELERVLALMPGLDGDLDQIDGWLAGIGE